MNSPFKELLEIQEKEETAYRQEGTTWSLDGGLLEEYHRSCWSCFTLIVIKSIHKMGQVQTDKQVCS